MNYIISISLLICINFYLVNFDFKLCNQCIYLSVYYIHAIILFYFDYILWVCIYWWIIVYTIFGNNFQNLLFKSKKMIIFNNTNSSHKMIHYIWLS